MSPNPTALRSLVKDEDVDKHRCVRCPEYDDCLEAALHMSWRSWSCARCALFLTTGTPRTIDDATMQVAGAPA